MAKKRKKIKPAVKRQIVKEAGSKCANPGCTNWRIHIHHIEYCAVYESNDKKILIAVCPTCHDAIHHGRLEIPDEALYTWKHIKRTKLPEISHLYIEPGEEIKLLAGTVAVSTTNQELIVFKLSQNNSPNNRGQRTIIANIRRNCSLTPNKKTPPNGGVSCYSMHSIDQISNRSSVITLLQAATKSLTNLSCSEA